MPTVQYCSGFEEKGPLSSRESTPRSRGHRERDLGSGRFEAGGRSIREATQLGQGGAAGRETAPWQQRQREADFQFKLILIGDAKVGKSCFLHYFVTVQTVDQDDAGR